MNKMRSYDRYTITIDVPGGKAKDVISADTAKHFFESAINFVSADRIYVGRTDSKSSETYYDLAHMTPDEWDEYFDRLSLN